MKRIAFAAATAALLGTGCISSTTTPPPPCDPTLSVSWAFQLYDGSPPTGCAGAGVTWVDVYVDNAFVVTSPCGDGGATIAVSPGTHSVLLEGIDSANRIAYRDSLGAVSTNGCGDRLLTMTPAEGSANLNYAAPGGCTSSPCYLWFSVYDDLAGQPAAAISAQSPLSVKQLYPYPGDVVIRLPVGSYTLDWMELVNSAFGGVSITCSTPAAVFDVGSALVTTVPASLTCVPL